MNINCINDKIANSKTALKPIILQAILDLFKEGKQIMTLKMVRQRCILLDSKFPKNSHQAAIANSMRNAIKCGGRIVGENRDFNDFTIAFDVNATNLEIKSTRGTTSKDKENRNMLEEKKISGKKIEDLKEKNSTSNNHSVFLIPCSSRKILKEELEDKPFDINKLEFNSELGIFRKELIQKLKIAEQNNTHKRKKTVTKNKIRKTEIIIIKNEFNFNKTAQAYKLYSKGRFYNNKASCSLNWSNEDQSKIYIISALFGIIRADNHIPLYDLAMTDELNDCKEYAIGFWKGKLDAIIKDLLYDGKTVYNLLSENYKKCLNQNTQYLMTIPKIEFTASDSSGKRGKWLKDVLNNNSI